MKKLFAILSAFVLVSSFAYAYDDGGKVNVKETSGGSVTDPVRIYTLVRYPEFALDERALSAGDVVVWDPISDDGVTVNLVGRGGLTISTDVGVAGVVVSTSIPTADIQSSSASGDMNRRNWGFIQTYGFCDDVMYSTDNGNASVGEGLVASRVNPRYATHISSSASAATGGFAAALDAASSNSNGNDAFIKTR